MVTSNQKDKVLMKCFIIYLFLLVFPVFCFAQDTIEAINGIKLSGKYFTAEATASSESEAKELAFMGLMERLSSYCEEMDIAEIRDDKVKASMLAKCVKRGDAVLVMIYVDKGIANVERPTVVFTPNNNTIVAIPNISSASASLNSPNIIKQIEKIDTYAGLQYLLNKAMDNGLVDDWGKYRAMSNPEACYLVMVNADRQIIGIFSPMKNEKRTNLKTGMLMDSESMSKFTNCVPICVLIK